MKKETEKTTTNNRVYKMILRKRLYDEIGLCHLCGPHSGCNSIYKYRGNRNWKKHRKTQYKMKHDKI